MKHPYFRVTFSRMWSLQTSAQRRRTFGVTFSFIVHCVYWLLTVSCYIECIHASICCMLNLFIPIALLPPFPPCLLPASLHCPLKSFISPFLLYIHTWFHISVQSLIITKKRKHICISFWDWLNSQNVVIFTHIHFPANATTSFLWLKTIALCMLCCLCLSLYWRAPQSVL